MVSEPPTRSDGPPAIRVELGPTPNSKMVSEPPPRSVGLSAI
ncbi:hypothetical protein A2U01_0021428, partial [Trifolium medium]|nr:hypothetical protein [Trifolium medium]